MSVALTLSLAPSIGVADPVSDAQEAVDVAESTRDDVLSRIDGIEREMDETYETIPTSKDALWHFIRSSYKANGGNADMALIEALLGCTTFDQAVSALRAHEAWQELGTRTVDTLTSRQTELEAQRQELNGELEQAEMTLQEAHEALEARQEEAEEAERVAAAEAAAASAAVSGAPSYEATNSGATYTLSEFMFMGVIYQNGFRYTYYSESVLPGGGLSIPGRHHEDGFVCDGDGYICVASNDLSYGSVVPVPFEGRMGKVYDCGCASGTIDIYIA